MKQPGGMQTEQTLQDLQPQTGECTWFGGRWEKWNEQDRKTTGEVSGELSRRWSHMWRTLRLSLNQCATRSYCFPVQTMLFAVVRKAGMELLILLLSSAFSSGVHLRKLGLWENMILNRTVTLIVIFLIWNYEQNFCVCFVNLTKLGQSGKREHQQRRCLPQTDLQTCLGGTFLSNNWCGRAQPTMDTVCHTWAVWSCIKKRKPRKPLRRVPTWALLLLQFLAWLPSGRDCDWFTQAFPPSHCF